MHVRPAGLSPDFQPCEIFFHIPKTGGQSLHNLIWREYRHHPMLDTHCGLLTTSVWQDFADRMADHPATRAPRYRVVGGHMKFGVHEMLDYPARYLTMLRDPVRRFASYYFMLQRSGHVPAGHRLDPDRADWNLSGHETLPRELDNGQTRALANADWDLPLGECTEDHLKLAQANLDRHFAFVGVTEHFDLSLMVLMRVCRWRWHFYVPRNVSPVVRSQRFSPDVLESIERLNRFDRQLHAHAKKRLLETARGYGVNLQMEKIAYMAGNVVHNARYCLRRSLKRGLKQGGFLKAAKAETLDPVYTTAPSFHSSPSLFTTGKVALAKVRNEAVHRDCPGDR